MMRLVLTLIGPISQIALGSCFLMSVIKRLRHFGREGHVDFAGDEGKHRGCAVRNDGELDAVQIWQAFFPIILVLRELDRLVLFELDKFERAGADRMGAHLRGCHVARIHRRIAGGEHGEQRGLRPLEMQCHLEVTVGGDLGNIAEQILARILAEFVLRLALQKVEGALHVLGGERLAVVPGHALA